VRNSAGDGWTPSQLTRAGKKAVAADLAVPTFTKNVKGGKPRGMKSPAAFPSWESRLPPFPQSMNKGGGENAHSRPAISGLTSASSTSPSVRTHPNCQFRSPFNH
jgi:hypothetical protein